MGFQKSKRPAWTVVPASNSPYGIDTELISTERIDFQRCQVIGSATSNGSFGSYSTVGIGPRGTWVLVSTSTVASTPLTMYLANPTGIGDLLELCCLTASSSAGLVLRTQSSGTIFIGTTSGFDALFFNLPGQSAYLRALSTTQWLFEGSTAQLYTSTS